jgi:phenylalanyl-tRNA synthetase beta chain
MYCSYQWLKDFVEFDYSPEELAEKLTMLGLEVDGYETIKRDYRNVIVGKLVEKVDSMQSIVDIGHENITVISRFSGLSIGDTVVVDLRADSPEIASYHSLDVSEDENVAFLGEGYKLGTKFSEIIPETDTVYDIDLTPNRPDCLGMIGIAREISAISGNDLKKPEISLLETNEAAADLVKVSIQATEGCPRYAVRVIKDVKIKASPLWMHDRLVKAGLRAINNVVDVTNYVMIEVGHPLHAFDYSLVQGNEIRVRLSEHGEHFVSLDGKGHTLNDQTVMICDAKRSIALGGIMGGLNSEVNDTTKDLLLECAYFNPNYIRNSSTKLVMSTDASMRFCRGVDPNGVEWAIDRTAQLFSQICSGNVLSGIVDEYVSPINKQIIRLRENRVKSILGTTVNADNIQTIFIGLGCDVADVNESTNGSKSYDVTVPTFRPDLCREIDLIEEVCRIVGFDQIPENYNSCLKLTSTVNSRERTLKQVRDFFIGNGLVEVLSNSMIPLSDVSLQFFEDETIKLQNPLSEDMAVLRPSLIPSLMTIAQYNLFRQQENIRLFEIGNTFHGLKDTHEEKLMLGGVFCGNSQTPNWKNENKVYDFFNLKGLLTSFFQKFGVLDLKYEPITHWALEDPSAQLEINGSFIGTCGIVKKAILNKYDILNNCFIFELNLENILSNIKAERFFKPVPKFPSVQRDLAFVVDLDVPGGKILDNIKKWGGTYFKDVNIFDIYFGKQVPIGKKSVAVSLVFQAEEKTLTENEINETVDQIIEKIKSLLKAELRS